MRLVAAVALLLMPAAAFAGPPYDTDDSEPTDLHHWEIYNFVGGDRTGGIVDGEAGFDLNYGALPGVPTPRSTMGLLQKIFGSKNQRELKKLQPIIARIGELEPTMKKKSDAELKAGADAGALVVLDAPDEVERAVVAGVRRVLVRVTPGIEADTHEAIRTAHHGSKFGLPPDDAVDAIRRAREAGLDVAGLHVHIGSQLVHVRAAEMTVEWLSLFAARCRSELDWTPSL